MIKNESKLIKRAQKRVNQGKITKLSPKHESCLAYPVKGGEANPRWAFIIKGGKVLCRMGFTDIFEGDHHWWFDTKVVIVDTNFKG